MRRRKAELKRRVNGEISVEFTERSLPSYAGLELLIRYFKRIDLSGVLRRRLGKLPFRGDYDAISMVRLIVGMLVVGGRRLRHVEYLRGDSLFLRLTGLAALPSERTLSRWLKNFGGPFVDVLSALNAEVVARVVKMFSMRVLMVDVGGTVVSTGMKVERAFRGYNPHHRKVPSYYPMSTYLAETGYILRVKNRSGNIHDGKASLTFLRALVAQIRQTLGGGYRCNYRMDGAFFREEVLSLLEAKGAGYAIKVPFWQWVELTSFIRENRRWKKVAHEVDGFERMVRLDRWGRRQRVAIYRKRVHHRSAKNYQLDLFDPANGYWEYSAVTTNLSWDIRRLWHFMCGRGMHEKVIGQLKSGLAFDTVPTNHYGANSAWQQLVAMAHNLLVNFQIETGACRKTRSFKRTTLFELKNVQTLRFEVFNRAGRLVRPNGRTILRLGKNGFARSTFLRLAQGLKKVA